MTNYLDHLQCSQCDATYPHDVPNRMSACCGKVLLARYDLARMRREVDRGRPAGARRHHVAVFRVPARGRPRARHYPGRGRDAAAGGPQPGREPGSEEPVHQRGRVESYGDVQGPGHFGGGLQGLGTGFYGVHHAVGGQRRRGRGRLLRPGRAGHPGVHAPGRARRQPNHRKNAWWPVRN